jgi:hypothetical protein
MPVAGARVLGRWEGVVGVLCYAMLCYDAMCAATRRSLKFTGEDELSWVWSRLFFCLSGS